MDKIFATYFYYWKAGINCKNSENKLDLFEKFVILEIAELRNREINQ